MIQKNTVLLAKSIPQRVIYLVCFEDEYRLDAYHTKLFLSEWQFLNPNSSLLNINSLNLDVVWQSLVSSIGQFSVEQENTLTEQIKFDEECDKLLRQMAALKHQMNSNTQPRRKRKLFLELQKLKHR